MPAATALQPSLNIALAKRVDVVVPSPASWLVFSATYFNNWAPRFMYLSLKLIACATVTPSLVILGAPNDYSIITFLPLGPKVTSTASANCSHPIKIYDLASLPNLISLFEKCLLSCFKTCFCTLNIIVNFFNSGFFLNLIF